jgi:hypothetical protein
MHPCFGSWNDITCDFNALQTGVKTPRGWFFWLYGHHYIVVALSALLRVFISAGGGLMMTMMMTTDDDVSFDNSAEKRVLRWGDESQTGGGAPP